VYNSSNNNKNNNQYESEYNCWGKSQSQSNKACKKKASRGGVCNALWRPSAVWRGGGCLFGSGERGERGSVGGLGGPVALLTDCQCVHVWVSVFFNARQHFCNSNNGNTTRRKILKSINKIINK